LSEQSKLLVSTSSDHRVCLWDLSGASDAAISAIVLEGHTSAVRDAAITPDSRYIVSVGDDQRAIVWRRQDASGGESIRYRRVADFLEHAAAVEAVAIQPNPTADCLLVATTGQDRTIRLWNAVSLFEDFDDAAFSKTRLPNLIAGSPPAEVPHRFLIGHQQDVRKLIFSKDGRFLLSGSDDHTLKVWDVTAGQLYRTLRGHSGGVQCCDLYEDGSTRAAVSGDHTAQLLRWNIDSHHEEDLVQDSAGQLGALLAAVVSENETRIATTGENHAINLWEPRSNGGVPASFVLTEGHEFLASRAEFLQHGDRRLIMTASLDGTTRLWDQVTGAQLAVMTGTGSNQVLAEVAANGEWILTGSNSATGPGALLWSVRDLLEASDQPPENRIVHPIARCPVDEEKITAIAFSPDSEWLFVAGERGRGLVCRVSSGQVETICEIAGHSSSLEAAAFVMIDDQLRLVTTAANGEIAQWNAANGHFLTPHMPVHASPVKRLAISSTLALAVTVTVSDDSRPGSQSGCTLHAYDLRTGRRVHQQLLTGKLLSSVRFSSDGMRLIATLQDFSANRDSVLTWLLRRGDDGQVQFPDSVEWPGSASLAGRFESSVLNAEASELLLVGGNLAQLLRIDGLDPGQEDTTELIMLYGSGAAVNGACFRRNGRLLVSAGQNGWITVWDTLLKRSVARHLGRRNRAITSIQPNPGSADQFLTVDGAGLMEFWELNDSGQPALADPNRTLQITAAGAVRVAAFSPDGQQLATAGSDETIRIWRHDPQTGWTEQFQSSMSGILKNMSAIAFDATAERLLVGGVDQLAILYPTMDPRPLVVEAHTGPITAVSFAPDGKRAVSGGVDHNLKLWKVDMPAEFSRPDTNQTTPSSVLTEVLTLRRHTDEVTDVRFCGKLPGSPILSCSRDGTAVLWLTKDDQNSGVGAANRRLSP
jgi:WD40 repeat protein